MNAIYRKKKTGGPKAPRGPCAERRRCAECRRERHRWLSRAMRQWSRLEALAVRHSLAGARMAQGSQGSVRSLATGTRSTWAST